MTVVRNLPEQLILAHAPWLLGGFLIACIVACCAAGSALLFAGERAGLPTLLVGVCIPVALFSLLIKREQVIFDTLSNTITLRRQSLWSYTSRTYALATFRSAELQTLLDASRPVLRFDTDQNDDVVPLIEAHESGQGPSDCVKLINAWHQAWRRENCIKH